MTPPISPAHHRLAPVYALFAFVGILFLPTLHAAVPKIQLEVVVEDQLLNPVGLTNAGDGSGRLFIVEQRGQILIFKDDMVQPAPFLDINAKVVPARPGFDERGLLGLVFHPDYATPAASGEGKFYVYYSAPSSHTLSTCPDRHKSVIAEYCVSLSDPDLANPASERILLEIDEPQWNHNSGQLAFGPDGYLYVGVGDGGGAGDDEEGHTGGAGCMFGASLTGILGNSLDRTNLLGKILRIDVFGTNGPGGEYGIPATNPFVGDAAEVGESGPPREEIFAFGLRNPWRFSFDPTTGRLFCSDVGQDKFEEINLITSGANYGWRIREAAFDYDNTAPNPSTIAPTDPIAQYAHLGEGQPGAPPIGASVTGGYVYRGAAQPSLNGIYFFCDWSGTFAPSTSGTLLGLEEGPPGTFSLSVLDVVGGNPIGRFIQAMGVGEDGEIYLLTKDNFDPQTTTKTGAILRLIAAGTPQSLTLEPAKDNTIYEESNNSNGAGTYLFSGGILTGPARRALLQFDLDGNIPTGSTIESASITLTLTNKAKGANNPMSLHPLTTTWGEAGSNAGDPGGLGILPQTGDATWNHRFYSTDLWTTPGGDFSPTASATINVSTTPGAYLWTSAALAADVTAWVSNPASNFGWVLKGDENPSSAKRWVSRESLTIASRPQLAVDYFGPPAQTHRQEWLTTYYLPGEFVDDLSDDDFDGIVALFEYAFGFSPLAPDTVGLPTFVVDPLGADSFVYTFRRDPNATDLTYLVEISDDLLNWVTIAISAGGATPSGSGFVSDDPIPGEAPFRLVTVQDPEAVSANTSRFIRLVLIR